MITCQRRNRQCCIFPMLHRVSTAERSKQKLLWVFFFPAFYFWRIKLLHKIVKAGDFLTYYIAVFIFHSLPVLMGLISLSAMITPQLASITGAWLPSRAKSSFPYTQPPHYRATEIHSPLTVKSRAAGFQMCCTLVEGNRHPSAPSAAVKKIPPPIFAPSVHKWCV